MTTSYYDDGNVRNLQRNGSTGSQVDNLNYDYRPGTHIDTLITNATGNPGSVYTYDSNGNVISDSRDNVGFTLYDTYNRPETIYKEDGTVIQYRYDPNGLRVEKEVGSTSNYYFRGKDGNPEVLMLDAESENTEFFTFANGNSLGEVTLDTTNGGEPYHYYYIKDHLGNIRVIVDMNGTVDAMNDYYLFGELMRSQVSAGPDPRYQFTSKELDAETGLYYFGARDYDSWSGTWMSVDTMANKYPGWSWSPGVDQICRGSVLEYSFVNG